MSSYPKPYNFPQTFFSPTNWPSYSDFLTIASANKIYLSKIGDDVDAGNLTLKQKLFFTNTTCGIYRISNGIYFKCNNTDSCGIDDTTLVHIGIIEGGYGFRSSSVGSATQVRYGDILQTSGMYFETGNKVAISANSLKTLGIEAGGVRIHNTGITNYTPSLLNCYEEYTFTTKFGFSAVFQTTDINCRVIRVGNKVTLIVPYWAQTITNGTGVSADCISRTALPARFACNSGTTVAYACGIVGGANTNSIMYIIGTTIYCMPTVGLWANGVQINWFGTSLTWFV